MSSVQVHHEFEASQGFQAERLQQRRRRAGRAENALEGAELNESLFSTAQDSPSSRCFFLRKLKQIE